MNFVYPKVCEEISLIIIIIVIETNVMVVVLPSCYL